MSDEGNPIRAAYTAHAQLKVSGVTMYDIAMPGEIEATLNAPACYPTFNAEADGEMPVAGDGVSDVDYTAHFLILIAPATAIESVNLITGQALDVIYAYLRALAEDSDLGGTLQNQVTPKLQKKVIRMGESGDLWYGVEITHTWTFYIDI